MHEKPLLARCAGRRARAAELLLERGIYLEGGRDHKVIVTALRVKGKGWLRLSSRYSKFPRWMWSGAGDSMSWFAPATTMRTQQSSLSTSMSTCIWRQVWFAGD